MTKKNEYFDKARGWSIDRREAEDRSRRTAWVVAGCACGVALLEAAALAILMPLKTTTPVTLLVDRTTGYVQSIDPLTARPIRADEVLIQSLLAQYVSARERFDRATVKADYRRAALWSSGSARNRYVALMAGSNPASPLNRYQAGHAMSVEVKSVSRIAPDTALVRFDTFLLNRTGRSQLAGSWISTVRYRFSDAAMSYEDRLINPLGLQVFAYRRDAERPERASEVNGDSLQPQAMEPAPAERLPIAPENEPVREGQTGQP